MDERTKTVRHLLRHGSPVKARAILEQVGLPEREHLLVLMHDIQDKDLCFVADTIGICERQAKTIHKRALIKIADTIL
ncbi:MAG: hypothetical protein J6S23_04270 [Clostridia bacterium]|nr:hypothetical protein [Clostridia bacterium]